MKRLQILLVGLVLLAFLGFAWLSKGYSGEILTSHTFVEINAPAEKVWAVLTDTGSYPQWNPYVVEVTGIPKVGERLKIVEQINGKRRSHNVLVTSLDSKERQLAWAGSTVPSAFLKWGESFGVDSIDPNHSRLVVIRSTQGLLAQMYWKYYKTRDLTVYREFVEALKKKAEQ